MKLCLVAISTNITGVQEVSVMRFKYASTAPCIRKRMLYLLFDRQRALTSQSVASNIFFH